MKSGRFENEIIFLRIFSAGWIDKNLQIIYIKFYFLIFFQCKFTTFPVFLNNNMGDSK